jgi:hypothetical protein
MALHQIMILLQVVFEGITGQEIRTENVNPLLEIGAIWPSAIRIAKGEIWLCLQDSYLKLMLPTLSLPSYLRSRNLAQRRVSSTCDGIVSNLFLFVSLVVIPSDHYPTVSIDFAL